MLYGLPDLSIDFNLGEHRQGGVPETDGQTDSNSIYRSRTGMIGGLSDSAGAAGTNPLDDQNRVH